MILLATKKSNVARRPEFDTYDLEASITSCPWSFFSNTWSLATSKASAVFLEKEHGDSDYVCVVCVPDLNPIVFEEFQRDRLSITLQPTSNLWKRLLLRNRKKIDFAKCCKLGHLMPKRLAALIKIKEAIQSIKCKTCSSFCCGVYSFLHNEYNE